MRRNLVLTLSVAVGGLMAFTAQAAPGQRLAQEPNQQEPGTRPEQAEPPGPDSAEPRSEPVRPSGTEGVEPPEPTPPPEPAEPAPAPERQPARPAQGEAERAAAESQDQVASDLAQAQTAARSGDEATAAQKLTSAAGELRSQAESMTGEDRRTLERAAGELERAAQVGTKQEGRLAAGSDKRVAHVEHDLAEFHLDRARRSWAREDAERTGHELRAAAQHLDNGTRWTGQKLEQGTREAVGAAMRVSGSLIEGGGWVPREVGRSIQDVGREVDKLGRKVTPSR
jgi:hypothetical protein